MRIGVIYLGRRGSGNLISLELAQALRRRPGNQVFAVISEQIENRSAWEHSELDLFTTPTYSSLIAAFLSWLNQPALRRLAASIAQRQPDVLIFPMFYTLNPFLQFHLRQFPSLVWVHDPIPHPGVTARAYAFLENLSIRQASRCIVLSQVFVSALASRGAPVEQVDVIPHGELTYYRRSQEATPRGSPAPRSSYAADSPAVERDGAVPTLLFFGRITAYKGLEVLLQAYLTLRMRRSQPVRLVIAGSGDLRPYLPLLHGLPVEDVEIANRWIADEEVSSFFQRASIVVLPYTSASQSGLLPIAASFGLPVVATRVGGLPEQLEHERNGLLVNPGPAAANDFAAAIERLLDDPALARSLGANLRQDYTHLGDWDSIAQKVQQSCQKAAIKISGDKIA